MDKLTQKQSEALPALITGRTVEESCKNADIARSTFYKWLQNPTFIAEYAKKRGMLTKEALDSLDGTVAEAYESLGGLISPACDKLKNLLESKNENIQVRAVTVILDQFFTIVEAGEIIGQIEYLKQRLDQAGI